MQPPNQKKCCPHCACMQCGRTLLPWGDGVDDVRHTFRPSTCCVSFATSCCFASSCSLSFATSARMAELSGHSSWSQAHAQASTAGKGNANQVCNQLQQGATGLPASPEPVYRRQSKPIKQLAPGVLAPLDRMPKSNRHRSANSRQSVGGLWL